MPLIPFLPSTTVLPSLQKAQLVPAVAPADFQPSVFLSITYNGKEVELGKELTPEETATEPVVSFLGKNPDRNESYTIMLLDFDAPSPADRKFSPWRHWVQPGLVPTTATGLESLVSTTSSEGELGSQMVKTTSEAATSYKGPGPNEGSGLHRYVFLLYLETSPGQVTKESTGGDVFESRRTWKHEEFVKEKGLELVATTWFKCRNAKDKEADLKGANDFL
ncbi:PEBP-like protein [Atractiella rhizophila]|nr:PEBP-like protein [Atractiella rhizophila]